jgi:hypothetical protein
MVEPLEELAGQVLKLRQYHRLLLVAELLDVFSSGRWNRIEEEQKDRFLAKLELDFNIRAWDDWDISGGGAYSRIAALIAAESKSLERRKA